jgi:hypothetical protein
MCKNLKCSFVGREKSPPPMEDPHIVKPRLLGIVPKLMKLIEALEEKNRDLEQRIEKLEKRDQENTQTIVLHKGLDFSLKEHRK